MTEATHTPGPWHWQVNEKTKSVMLMNARTTYVMGLKRWGTQGAQPILPIAGIMHDASTMLVSYPGREHHRDWFADINHPNARLIASSPVLLEMLEALVDTAERVHTNFSRQADSGIEELGDKINEAKLLLQQVRGSK